MWVLHIIAYNTVIEPIVLILFGFAIHFIYIATFAVSFSFNIYYYCVCDRCFSVSPSFYPNSNLSIYVKFFSPSFYPNSNMSIYLKFFSPSFYPNSNMSIYVKFFSPSFYHNSNMSIYLKFFSPSFHPNSNMSIYLKFFSPHNISNSWNEINTIINFESFFLIFLLLIFAWWQFTVQDYHQNCSRFQHICCYFHILDSKFCASII